MLKLKKIAVTGCLASGKSEVARLLEESGAYRIDADKITHQILSSEPVLKEKITQLLGSEVIHNGAIDRSKVAQMVFSDPLKLQTLEELLHPFILQKILSKCEELEQSGAQNVVVEVPLLYEVGWQSYFDTVIVVTSSEEKRKERYRKMGLTDRDYTLRMQRQWPEEKKIELADIVLENNGDLNALKQEIKHHLTKIFA